MAVNQRLDIKVIEAFTKELLGEDGDYSDTYSDFSSYDSTEHTDFYAYLSGNSEASDDLNKYFAKGLIECFSETNLNDLSNGSVYLKKVTKKIAEIANRNYVNVHEKSSASSGSERKNTVSKNESMLKRAVNMALDDGKEIAIRNAAEQLSKGIVEPLAGAMIMALQLEDNDSTRAKILRFLNSDLGTKLVGFAVSFGLPLLPVPDAAKPYLLEVGRELRIQGEMAVAKPIIETVAAPVRMLLTEKVMNLALPGMGIPVEKQLTAPAEEIKVTTTFSEEVQTAVVKPVKKVAKKRAPKKVKVSDTRIKVSFKEEKSTANAKVQN